MKAWQTRDDEPLWDGDGTETGWTLRITDWGQKRAYEIEGVVITSRDVGYMCDVLSRMQPSIRVMMVTFANLVLEANKEALL